MPKVYNQHHKNYPLNAVYVGRPTVWGNPFALNPKLKGKDREEVIRKYQEWIEHPDQTMLYYRIREELAGKDLVCFCAPKACHADILMEIANAGTETELG